MPEAKLSNMQHLGNTPQNKVAKPKNLQEVIDDHNFRAQRLEDLLSKLEASSMVLFGSVDPLPSAPHEIECGGLIGDFTKLNNRFIDIETRFEFVVNYLKRLA